MSAGRGACKQRAARCDPVVCVRWHDAKAYVAWLNAKLASATPIDGEGPYRLPSEAERSTRRAPARG